MGRIEEKLAENKTKNKEFKVLCVKCRSKTKHKALQSMDYYRTKWYNKEDTIDSTDNYQIIQCQGCETISFRHLSWFSEAQDIDSDGFFEILYPKRSATTLPIRDFKKTPIEIRRIYRETIDCFNNDNFTLCAAGLRVIVEGLCADQGIKDGQLEIKKKDGTLKTIRRKDLRGKIAGLCEKGILTVKNSAILHEHRFLGNEAVHRLSQPSADELMLAIEIVEHIIDSLYEIPEKAIELQEIKTIRKSRNQSYPRVGRK